MHARIGPTVGTAVLCHAWFFFGFLYEEIVDVPNMMMGAHAAEAQSLWDLYHSVTNPVFYCAIVAVPVLGSLAFLWLKRGGLSPANQTCLRLATYGHLAMAALTFVAVTQINGTLYFGPPINDPARVDTLAWAWHRPPPRYHGSRINGIHQPAGRGRSWLSPWQRALTIRRGLGHRLLPRGVPRRVVKGLEVVTAEAPGTPGRPRSRCRSSLATIGSFPFTGWGPPRKGCPSHSGRVGTACCRMVLEAGRGRAG
ncbi:hypothetical protein [Streptomyces sp. NPDC005533]|uniref:hypothetical protein n=1 Tax=Streptomyces sp. NPDC005533 TaxID=3364723 RepID=UPI0036C88659